MSRTHLFQIERNLEGAKVAYLSPLDADGKMSHGYRIAGPKAWGGSTTLAEIEISTDSLVTYIKEYAPDVIAALQDNK